MWLGIAILLAAQASPNPSGIAAFEPQATISSAPLVPWAAEDPWGPAGGISELGPDAAVTSLRCCWSGGICVVYSECPAGSTSSPCPCNPW